MLRVKSGIENHAGFSGIEKVGIRADLGTAAKAAKKHEGKNGSPGTMGTVREMSMADFQRDLAGILNITTKTSKCAENESEAASL
jgi:hypothetical protein